MDKTFRFFFIDLLFHVPMSSHLCFIHRLEFDRVPNGTVVKSRSHDLVSPDLNLNEPSGPFVEIMLKASENFYLSINQTVNQSTNQTINHSISHEFESICPCRTSSAFLSRVNIQHSGPYSLTILKNILCPSLQDIVNLNVTQLLIG